MLPAFAVVAARAAIEGLYDGLCTVTTRQEVMNEDGSTGFRDHVAYRDQPCRVSFGQSPAGTAGEAADTVGQTITLFAAPELTIPAGSSLSITRGGVTTLYRASGAPRRYETHQAITLVLAKEMA